MTNRGLIFPYTVTGISVHESLSNISTNIIYRLMNVKTTDLIRLTEKLLKQKELHQEKMLNPKEEDP